MKRMRKVSGQITWQMKRDRNIQQDYWKRFISRINGLATFRREKSGYHLYSGGRLFSVGNPIEQNSYARLTAGFRDSKPCFVDVLFGTSTEDFETCNISFFLRDETIDFESLKRNLRSWHRDLREEANGNFSTRIRKDGMMLRLSGYPQMRMITLSSSFTRGGLKPSRFLDQFTEMNLDGN